jgi:hypothetical protein
MEQESEELDTSNLGNGEGILITEIDSQRTLEELPKNVKSAVHNVSDANGYYSSFRRKPRQATVESSDIEQRQKPFGKATAGSITPLQRLASRVIAGPHYEEPVRGAEEWQDHLRSLQQWVCDLLIKNEELRMALDSATAQEKKKDDGESN